MSDYTLEDESAVDRDGYDDEQRRRGGEVVSALLAILGAWLLLEAVLFDLVFAQRVNDFLVGVLLVAIGGYNYYRRANQGLGSVAAAGLAVLLGAWLVAAPWILGVDVAGEAVAEDLAFWNDIVVGLLVVALGAYSAYAARKDRRTADRLAT